MRYAVTLFFTLISSYVFAANSNDILLNNTRAIVYLEVNDDKGNYLDSGTGFIVSHDGYVVTADHVKPDANQTLWAVVGQREGTRFALQFRDRDEDGDVALWQLPQSASCKYAVTLSTNPPKVLDNELAIGFPGHDGLTPAALNIANLSDGNGFYEANGFLRNGYSGGPVFDEDGNVIATVRSGTPQQGNSQLVPISIAINLLKKRGVQAGLGSAIPFDLSCFASCRVPSNGIEKWTSQSAWGPVDSGELPGGHNRHDECAKLIAAATAGKPDTQIELLPGEGDDTKGMWEKSKKDILGAMHYTYFCQGIIRSGPIYAQKRSSECGLWN